MSFLLDDLEGDVEDFEGDADLNEWAAMGEDAFDVAISKPRPSYKQKENSPKPQSLSTSPSQRSRQSMPDTARQTASLKSKTSITTKPASGTESSQSKRTDPSDLVGVIESLDNPKGSWSDSKNMQLERPQLLNSVKDMKPLKRKSSTGPPIEMENSKSKKVESDILMAIEDPGDRRVSSSEVEDRDHTEQKLTFTAGELRDLDSCLVSEMMGAIKKQMFLRMDKGDRFVVTFAPVELADLAESSVQHLVESQPSLAFFFNRQGKFKKKKGYAQAYFTLTSEVREFINTLMYVKLCEGSTEVSVSAIMNSGKHNVQVSFLLSSSHKGQLMKLLDTGEDPCRSAPLTSYAQFQLEKVSTEATVSMLMLLFPYASSVSFNYKEAKDMGPGYKGPVNVYYLNQQWMDAVMKCCSDFRYNGTPVSALWKEKQRPDAEKSKPDARRVSSDAERNSQSESPGGKEIASKATPGKKVLEKMPGEEHESRSRHSSSSSNMSGSDKGDDDISNMTLDVCAGMMESLDKLKQMGTDNPNVLKILEMQSQLAALQKSLTKKNKQGSSLKSSEDPWETSELDVSTEGEGKGDKPKASQQKDAKKSVEIERGEHNQMEVEMLGSKPEEAHQKDMDRETRTKEQLENERQRSREVEGNRNRNQAKQMIEEARQNRVGGCGTPKAGQKIIQSMADKRREDFQSQGEVTAQHSRPSYNPGVQTKGQARQASLHGTRDHRKDHPIQDWNPVGFPRPEALPFQDNFSAMTSFMEGFPGRSPSAMPLVSTPRSAGPDKSGSFHHKRKSDDEGLQSRLEEFQKELAQKGVVSPVKVPESYRSIVSPDRQLHEGVPVYTEKEYHRRRNADFGHQLPPDFYIQTTFLPNRRCPVHECPASKVFKTEPMFLDHWDMFHKLRTTMRFCRRCTAYFVHPEELRAHLVKAHNIADHMIASKMVAEARVKVVNNPSYRDPGRFLAPPI